MRIKQTGATLIELVIAISIMAGGLVLLLDLFSKNTARSSDALQQQQGIIIAEGFMDEIRLQPFLDPTVDPIINPTIDSALSVPCAGITPAVRNQFNDVCDYHEYRELGVKRFTDLSAIPNLSGYQVDVSVQGASFVDLSSDQAVKITVLVTTPIGQVVELSSYRSRY